MSQNESNLWLAIKELKRAKRFKCHSKIIELYNNKVKEEAKKVACILNKDGKYTSLKQLVDKIMKI